MSFLENCKPTEGKTGLGTPLGSAIFRYPTEAIEDKTAEFANEGSQKKEPTKFFEAISLNKEKKFNKKS